MLWPPGSQQPVVEITLPLPEPAQQPTPSYSASERYRALEVQVRQLALTVHELNQTVTALQQQQQTPARRRRRWYQRLTVETWE